MVRKHRSILTALKNLTTISAIISIVVVVCANALAQSKTTPSWRKLYDRLLAERAAKNWPTGAAVGDSAIQAAVLEFGETDSIVGMALHSTAVCYHSDGKLDSARNRYLRAVQVWERLPKPQPLKLAKTLSNLSIISHHSVAESYLRRSLELKKEFAPDSVQSITKSMVKLGRIQMAEGMYTTAEKTLTESYELSRSLFGEDNRTTLSALGILANLFHGLARFRDAIPIYLKLAENEKDRGNWAAAVGYIGNEISCYNNLNRPEKAKQECLRWLHLFDSLQVDDAKRRAQLLKNLADTYFLQREYEKAERTQLEELEIVRAEYDADHAEVLRSYYNLARIYRLIKKWDKADSLFRFVTNVRLRDLPPRSPELAQTLLAWSRLKTDLGDFDSAFVLSSDGYGIHSINFREVAPYMPESDVLRFSRNAKSAGHQVVLACVSTPTATPQRVNKAAEVAINIKGAVSDEIFRRHRTLSSITDSSLLKRFHQNGEVRQQLAQLLISYHPDQTGKEQLATIDSLTRESEDLERELVRLGTDMRLLGVSDNITTEDVIAAIPNGTTVIEYLLVGTRDESLESEGKSKYVALVMDDSGIRGLVPLGKVRVIDSSVAAYREHMNRIADRRSPPTRMDAASYDSQAAALGELVWRPVEQFLELDTDLIIAPDGSLNLVSFAGLKTTTGRFLVEDYRLQYVGAARDLLKGDRGNQKPTRLLVLGDPDYDAIATVRKQAIGSLGSKRLASGDLTTHDIRAATSDCGNISDIVVSRLPASRREAEAVSRSWQNRLGDGTATVLVDAAASEDNLRRQATGRDAIHLITHGYYLEDNCDSSVVDPDAEPDSMVIPRNPLIYSGLFLAGGNLHGKDAAAMEMEDGILTAVEAIGLDLKGVQSVVLSACETGLGDIESGEGVYGLRRAFRIAGAQTVVSALWSLPDRETAELMADLYESPNGPIAYRLRNLQLERITKLRRAGFADHPFTWAAFVAVGE